MQNKNTTAKKSFREDLLNRIHDTTTTRWIRFGIVAVIWAAFSIWVGAWWLWLVLFLLFDIYITHYIPFTWWKKSKNKAVKTVMSWVDAIVYALILVYFVFNFVGQNYQIPSSSLEKTLLTGDYLFVNKMTYGPRVPITPIHFPLVHNTLPFIGGNSYANWPHVKYKRLKGFRNVESGDIVVFNFPAGDTVMSKVPNPDYYQLIDIYGYYNVNNNPQAFGEKIARPVDRRENYVKRAVGLPGERIKIVDGQIFIDNIAQPMPENAQFNYFIQTPAQPIADSYWESLGVTRGDISAYSKNDWDKLSFMENNGIVNDETAYLKYIEDYLVSNNFDTGVITYNLPLTTAMTDKLKTDYPGIKLIKMPAEIESMSLYPATLSRENNWTRANYGGADGILIPKKGMTVDLNRENWLLYERPIRVYENNPSAQWRDGKVYIDGKPQDSYTFLMDYYFMMGDNRDNSLDSRYWGFVPEDHIVGTPWRVIISFDKDKSLFGGKIRFNRIFKDANPDK